MQTIIYGGAFDPPQRAHVEIVRRIHTEFRPNRLIILPSGANSFKKFRAASEHRARMAGLVADLLDRDLGGVELCDDFLLGRVGESGTRAVDEYFRERIGYAPTQVFGADTVPAMSGWRHGEYVCREVPKILVGRPGYAIDTSGLRYAVPCSFVLPPDIADLSSTRVRDDISR